MPSHAKQVARESANSRSLLKCFDDRTVSTGYKELDLGLQIRRSQQKNHGQSFKRNARNRAEQRIRRNPMTATPASQGISIRNFLTLFAEGSDVTEAGATSGLNWIGGFANPWYVTCGQMARLPPRMGRLGHHTAGVTPYLVPNKRGIKALSASAFEVEWRCGVDLIKNCATGGRRGSLRRRQSGYRVE
jgi:hypothetical protein